MKATIYHNPRCSKSRQTLALLQEKGIELEIIEYLKTPPDTDTLKSIIERLGIKPAELLRRKEGPYKELQLSTRLDDDAGLIQAMVDNPVLIERPIVLANRKAAIGRPPENVLDIL